MTSKKNILCFGGGNVVPKLIIEPLKKYPLKITGVTSMVDSGGSTGQLRRDFNVLPPGDIRRHILALSKAPKWKKDLWQFRFGQEDFGSGHKGHNFANAFIAGLECSLKDYRKVLDVVSSFMELGENKALPSTTDKVQLMAELENGQIIEGEDEIDAPKKHDPNLKIKRIYLKPAAKIFPQTREAIMKADMITFGPGDLYSSIIPCILPEGMEKALKKTKAKKVLIVNSLTKLGETNNFSVMDFAGEVEKYMASALDFVIYNTKIFDKERIGNCRKALPCISGQVRVNDNLNKNKFIGKDLLPKSGPMIYDPKKLTKILLKLLK